MPTVLMILLIAGIIVAVVVIGRQRMNRLLEEGKVMNRDAFFWDEAEHFLTTATFDTIVETIKSTDLSECSVSVKYDTENNKIIFNSTHSWNAALVLNGTEVGKNVFVFLFTSFTTRKGIPYRQDLMNMLETSIEKAILSVDESTVVETHKVKRKTTL